MSRTHNGFENFRQVRRSRLYEDIVQQFRLLIESGKLSPGDRLPSEKELSEIFGVSRAAVREAMSALEMAGIVDVRHGSGTYLRDVSEQALIQPLSLMFLAERNNFIELLELRRAIEGEAAYLAAERAAPEDLEALERALIDLETAFARRDPDCYEADYAFHHALAAATENATFIKVIESLSEVLREQLREVTRLRLRKSPTEAEAMAGDHRRLLERIKARDPDGAREAVRRLLENALRGIADGAPHGERRGRGKDGEL